MSEPNDPCAICDEDATVKCTNCPRLVCDHCHETGKDFTNDNEPTGEIWCHVCTGDTL